MTAFLLRRLGQALLTIFGVATLIFFLQRLTGDPTYLLVPETATQADIEALRHALGFDRPLWVQYLSFLGEIARFDLGRSVVQHVPVAGHHRLAPALHAGAGGRRAAGRLRHRHSGRRRAGALARPLGRRACWPALVLAAQSMPTFWSGILLILVFAVTLGWLPPSSTGGIDASGDAVDRARACSAWRPSPG